MAQPIFDTLGFVKRLSAAGMDTAQADALADALTSHAFEELTTKADLRELELRLREEFRSVELRLTMRIGAMCVAAVAILAALITFS